MIYFKPLTTGTEWEWMRQRANPMAVEDSQGIVAYRGDTIIACAVFDSFTVDSCSVHLAIDDPFVLRHGFLQEIGRHLFIDCGRNRIFGMVPSNNKKALKLDTHIGMREVCTIPDGWAKGVDYIIMRMDKEECRWIEQEREAA